ncbi:MAG: Hsp70 family protein [Deltaproteobacteria bacterium]|nr:Hsp70 family protein [Deltaproteobacteria bacterium]
MPEKVISIDLGTTFSVVAHINDRGRPEVINNAEGQKTTPSVVLLENGHVEVGEVAMNQCIAKRDNVVRWIKRAIGEPDYRFHGLSAIEISAEILKKLKRDTELELAQPITEAVITCPAYFSSIEVENTKKAGELAGFHVREIVKEPTAAAVYYGVENLREGEKLLVTDLGGGTYDATILTLEKGVFRPLGSTGDRQLGGHDWTMLLLEHVSARFTELFGDDPRNDSITEQTLYEACEKAKRDFSHTAQVDIACTFQGRAEQVTVTRDEFEALTEWKMQQVIMWSEKALEKCEPPLTWNDIDHLLLVGGSTRLRRMGLALQEVSGKKPIQTGEVDTMVALGAAILATGQVRLRKSAGGLVDIGTGSGGLVEVPFARTAPRHLGTRVLHWEQKQPSIINSVIIPYNTDLPADRTRSDYRTSSANQPFFDVPIVEFDDVGEDVVLDTYRFTCLPNIPKDNAISVTFKYNVSGEMDVDATDQRTGRTLSKERVRYQEPDLSEMTRVAPRCIVFALDVSGSMSGLKLSLAKQAVIDNAQSLLAASDGQFQVGVVTFGSDATVVCRPTTNINEIKSRLSPIDTSGTTAMDQGIEKALSLLSALPFDTTREIAMVTDGMPDDAAAALQISSRAISQGVSLCVVGLGSDDVDENFLRQLTPNFLVIDSVAGQSQALATLLTQSSGAGGQSGIPLWGQS